MMTRFVVHHGFAAHAKEFDVRSASDGLVKSDRLHRAPATEVGGLGDEESPLVVVSRCVPCGRVLSERIYDAVRRQAVDDVTLEAQVRGDAAADAKRARRHRCRRR